MPIKDIIYPSLNFWTISFCLPKYDWVLYSYCYVSIMHPDILGVFMIWFTQIPIINSYTLDYKILTFQINDIQCDKS